ncbi:EAL domain-containing protein [Ciceribacter sp. RN22]|uniref:bifunctional diguanylate cyclase/phosphodiesterase n=1 Tax=Ciceribacter sp. RN22 TaxID=2954932 RepID=UPI0020932A06|nr:EAL domain-containing protein [Ciceribacter sp. RN22]MCO6179201.1 EAL domain-containing protein [Ciceribacter sp. RN22]
MSPIDDTRPNWKYLRSVLPYYLPAIIVVAGLAVSMIYAEKQRQRIGLDNLRAEVTENLGLVRAKLEGNMSGNIQLLKGLVAALETQPTIDEARFSALSERILSAKSQLRNVVGAPDLKVAYVYPYEANKAVIGLDYRTNPAQRDGAMKAAQTGNFVVTGPVNLVQGGRGLVVRYPVKIEREGSSPMLWGIVSGVVDIEKLFADSGLFGKPTNIDVAIATTEGGRLIETFYGDSAIFAKTPVSMLINFGHESWKIAAIPKGGWDQPQEDMWLSRLLMLAVGAMILAPVLWVARLLAERQKNIAVLSRHQEELHALSHRLDIALEASKIGVWELDLTTGALNWDGRMAQLYGVEISAFGSTYETWRNALHPDDLEEAERVFRGCIAEGTDYATEFRIITPSGQVRHIRALGTTYRDSFLHRKMVGVNWNVTADITLQQELREAKARAELQNRELELARQHMEHNSLHDALTSLPNRRYLDQYLAKLSEKAGEAEHFTLLHIDLDRFKDINDTLGHAAGDHILRQAALRLRASIRADDFVARIGGDEFVVVCAGVFNEREHLDLAKRLIDAINLPLTYAGHECRIGASIGLASRADSGMQIEQLLVNADIALYEAKRHGRNRVERYNDDLKSLTIHTKKTADAILRSLEQNGFVSYFQPQFCAHTLEITGVEALARWDHPEHGILGPDTFLKVAENLNVVSQIDAMILDQALFQLARWRANDLDIRKVSVNISAQRLFDESLFQHLDRLELLPGSLSFELLESISFDDKGSAVVESIERIRRHGIDIEIDDFGTGYASILSLLKISPRRLKIDRQLVYPIIEAPAQRRLISSIVEIGRSLGIEIVAEGVETMEHAAILRDLGCQSLQGYALARPMDGATFLRFAKERACVAAENNRSA